MSIFDIASALVLLAALFGYLNLRFLKLPPTIGLMIIALVSSLAIILMDQITPSYHMRDIISEFIGLIDLNETLVKGMLGFLLFAGALLGFVFGYVAFLALKSIDNYQIEVLITLALVMFTYSAASMLHISGPIAEVVAGLLVGNHGKRFAMSTTTTDRVEKIWSLIDEILNAVVFLLIGLKVFAIQLEVTYLISCLALIPTILAVRFISVSIPINLLRFKRDFSKGVARILTWSGLRGGISVALVLSLPPFEGRDLLLTCTYIVVLFSIIVQGLTLKPFIDRIQSEIK